jgi:cytochrome c oxidase subunit 4
MTETHHGEAHHHPNYWAVFGALVLLTAVSFITITDMWVGALGAQSGRTVVMLVAICKALLVALYFMHLKYDWFKVYVMIVPALILGTVLVCALLPDITFSHSIKYLWLGYGAE